MFQTPWLVAAVSGLMLAGVGANEMTHGGFAEGMGLGHNHMADHGGYHCAGPEDADWQRHVEHMHEGDATWAGPYGDHCGGGHMAHHGDGGRTGGMP